MVEVLAFREVDEGEAELVMRLMREFGAPDVPVAFVDESSAELFGVDMSKRAARLVQRDEGYLLLVRRPDKLSIWRELALLEILEDPSTSPIWALPEDYRGREDAAALSLALLNRLIDVKVALRDAGLIASSLDPGSLPLEAEDVEKSLIYTLDLDATVSLAVAGFRALAEELFLKFRRAPIYDLYSKFRNFVINNFKFEQIYNYLLIINR
nr:MAG: hypothetical protein TU35_01885 [Thermoproteus sp. AZ2]